MNNNDVPIWEKYTLTIEEAAKYFRIGESKLRKLAEENPVPDWVMMNGNRQKAPAGCRIDRYTTLRGTSKRKNKISTTYKAAFLTPTLENRNAAFLCPHVMQ